MTGRRTDTEFIRKWGIHAEELAEQEGVSPDAIHMRVMNFGTPYQRKSKPSLLELMYGKTLVQIAEELNLHPMTLQLRLSKHGCVYAEGTDSRGKWNKGLQPSNTDWRDNAKYSRIKPWLHPNHPDSDNWRHQYLKQMWSQIGEQ